MKKDVNITSSRNGTGGNARIFKGSWRSISRNPVLKLHLFLEGHFYGTLKMRNQGGVMMEEELTAEIEQRLPLLKGKKYTIEI